MEYLLNREYNEKCVLISGGVVASYYILPPDRWYVATFLAFATYIGIAHYDSVFMCQDRLVSYDSIWTTLTKSFKPPVGPDKRYT